MAGFVDEAFEVPPESPPDDEALDEEPPDEEPPDEEPAESDEPDDEVVPASFFADSDFVVAGVEPLRLSVR